MGVQLFSHMGVTVSDLARARRFYAEGLGLTEVLVGGQPRGRRVAGATGRQVGVLLGVGDVELETLYLERDGMTVELVEYRQPAAVVLDRRPSNAAGLTHICFMVDDLPAQVAALVELGGRVLEATETTVSFGAADGIHAVFVLDPDGGVKVELIQRRTDLRPAEQA